MRAKTVEPYAAWAKKTMGSFTGQDLFTKESDVAETVRRAAHDTTGRLRFPAGPARRCGAASLSQSALTTPLPGD